MGAAASIDAGSDAEKELVASMKVKYENLTAGGTSDEEALKQLKAEFDEKMAALRAKEGATAAADAAAAAGDTSAEASADGAAGAAAAVDVAAPEKLTASASTSALTIDTAPDSPATPSEKTRKFLESMKADQAAFDDHFTTLQGGQAVVPATPKEELHHADHGNTDQPKRRNSLKDMQEFMNSFRASQENVRSMIDATKKDIARVDESINKNVRRLSLTKDVLHMMSLTTQQASRRRSTFQDGGDETTKWKTLRHKSLLKVSVDKTKARLADLGMSEDGSGDAAPPAAAAGNAAAASGAAAAGDGGLAPVAEPNTAPPDIGSPSAD